jgi:MoaA/NifB/PqqE/SkfB family radical SAM enzyme
MPGLGDVQHFEIQLGHLCNDRCVFCVSSRLTRAGQAPLLQFDALAAEIRAARAAGHQRILFLGGEPTIQPVFLDAVRLAVDLGFERIGIFSNGSKLGSTDLVDRILATGGSFEWRFSVQGATREAHERTTGRKGGFDQVLRAIARIRERGQRATVNVCLVRQNYESVAGYGELLAPLGIAQLHVDVLNPHDTGNMTDEELVDIMPRHSDAAPPIERLALSFPADIELSIGSLPFCVAPSAAPWIHHDHIPMWTVSVDTSGGLKPARFLARSNDKVKPERCRECVFDERCSGVFSAYARRFGTDELRPISQEQLESLATYRHLVAIHLRPHLRAALPELTGVAPWIERIGVEEVSLREVFVTMRGHDGAELRLLLFDARTGAAAASDWCALRVEKSTVDVAVALEAARALWSRLERAGMRTTVPLGGDAFQPLHGSVAARLQRLRDAAPFGLLAWTDTRVLDGGQRVEITLRDGAAVATIWLAVEGGRPRGGYRLEPGTAPTDALVDGLRSVMDALGRAPARS